MARRHRAAPPLQRRGIKEGQPGAGRTDLAAIATRKSPDSGLYEMGGEEGDAGHHLHRPQPDRAGRNCPAQGQKDPGGRRGTGKEQPA